MNDYEIIELYNARSEKAIDETDKKYGRHCRNTAYNILHDREDSEECVNDTYLKVWNVIPPQRPARFGAFIMRIVRNLAVDLSIKLGTLKNGGEFTPVSFEEIAEFLPAAESVESTVNSKAVLAAIEAFLRALPKKKRIMFVRRYFFCSTYAEIASELGMTEGSVTMTLRRLREKLRKHLEEEGVEI